MALLPRSTRVALPAGCAALGLAGSREPLGGKVKFNGADPARVPGGGTETGCQASVGLTVDEPDKTTATANVLDLRGITRAEWTGLAASTTPFSITMGGGNDTVFGTAFADSIAPGNGDDTVHGNDGADTAQVDATDAVSNVETIDAPADQPDGTPDKVKPKVAFVSKKLLVKSGKASLKIKCPAGESACTGKARILRGKKVVGSIAVKLSGGQSKTLKITLKRKTRLALSKEQDNKLPVLVKISVKDAAGNTGQVSRQLNLKG
jgi:hypothetical protein